MSSTLASSNAATLLGLAEATALAPAAVAGLRRAGLAAFRTLGLPTTDDEEWRYTNVAPLGRTTFEPAARAEGPIPEYPRFDGLATFVFVNGRYRRDLSDPGSPRDLGVRVFAGSFHEALGNADRALDEGLGSVAPTATHAFAAWNAALADDGFLLRVPRGVAAGKAVHLVHVAAGAAEGAGSASAPRVLVVLEEGARATLVETFVGAPGTHLAAPVAEAVLGANASLDHLVLQMQGAGSTQIGLHAFRLERDARLTTSTFSFGGALVRNEAHVTFAGPGAEASLSGLFCAAGKQHVDNHLVVDHAAPQSSSRQSYKGILGGEAHGVFDGRVVVRAGAAKTDARQINRNLLLSPTARVDSKPQLEIDNNDVKASHGSSTGRLDEDALFYLRSRGLSEGDARALLRFAFGSELLEGVRVEPVRRFLEKELLHWLPEDVASVAPSGEES